MTRQWHGGRTGGTGGTGGRTAFGVVDVLPVVEHLHQAAIRHGGVYETSFPNSQYPSDELPDKETQYILIDDYLLCHGASSLFGH